MAYERLDKTYTIGEIWDQTAISRIDNAFEELIGSQYIKSPNLWSITLTAEDMTGKYYMQGKTGQTWRSTF